MTAAGVDLLRILGAPAILLALAAAGVAPTRVQIALFAAMGVVVVRFAPRDVVLIAAVVSLAAAAALLIQWLTAVGGRPCDR